MVDGFVSKVPAHLNLASIPAAPVQANKKQPAHSIDDEEVISELVAKLKALQGSLPADFKLSPVQFEKVGQWS